MIPSVSPGPLSACTEVGMKVAYPQPFAINCSCQVGPGKDGGSVPLAAIRARRAAITFGSYMNCKMTGTGPAAFAGVVNVNWMSTVTRGYDELSTWPISCLVMAGTPPTFSVT